LEPTLILASGATSAELLRRAAVLDLFGYYLATAVVAYVLWRQLRPRNPFIADLSTTAAVGYALAGGVGAAVLAMVAPMLMHGYTDTPRRSGAHRGAVRDCVAGGVACHLAIPRCHPLGGVVARNRVAPPPRSSRLSRLSLVLAAAAATGAADNVAGLSVVRDVLLGVLFVLWTAWWISVLVVFARQSQAASTRVVVTNWRLADGHLLVLDDLQDVRDGLPELPTR
jgi:hypothetical protein